MPDLIKACALFFLLLLVAPCVSPRIIVNSKGERIIMYPDGSWRPAEAGDSLLIRQYLQGSESFSSQVEKDNGKQERNKGEEQEYMTRQWTALYGNLLTEEKKVQTDFRTATNAQFKAAEQLRNAEANKKLIEPHHLASLTDAYDTSVRNLRMAKLRQKDIQKIVEKATKLKEHPSKINYGKFSKIRSLFNLYLARHDSASKTPFEVPTKHPPAPTAPTKSPMVKKESTPSIPVAQKANTKTIFPGMLPPHRLPKAYASKPFECVSSRDTIDVSSGRRRIELEPSLIFTHTDAELRPYFKDKDLITCQGRLSKIGPYTYLTIEFQIASSHSQSNFGSLQSGSLLRFKLLDGEYISLYNLKSDRGRIDPYSGHTIFSGQYALGKKEIKKLKDASLDKMRILWGTGFEDYDVTHVDFMTHQIHCLLSKT